MENGATNELQKAEWYENENENERWNVNDR